MNAEGDSLLKFYIFMSNRIKDYYIKHCKSRTCMTMQTKEWMITLLFKEFHSFFKRPIIGGISSLIWHLLVLKKHGSHAMLEAIDQAQ
jgi:hypothetical protein